MTTENIGVGINYLANLLSENTNLIRIFRVYHPVYRMHVNIDVEYHDPSYHIIERYMDMLICGYSQGDRFPEKNERKHYVRSRQELYQLLGLSGRASQIADEYFRDLYESGHFRVVDSQLGRYLEGTTPAFESVRLNEMVHSSLVEEMKIFDQYSLQIMPESFERIIRSARTIDDTDITERNDLKSIWIPMRPEKANLLQEINELLKRTSYSGKKAIELGLPQGKISISLTDHEIPEPMFFPYYLGVFSAGKEVMYRAYSMDMGEEIEGLTELYAGSEYAGIRDFMGLFLYGTNSRTIEHPFYKYKFRSGNKSNTYLRKDGALGAGITQEPGTGNYCWNITDLQIKELTDEYHRTRNASPIKWLLNNTLFCLETGEIGKLLHVRLSTDQRRVLEQVSGLNKSLKTAGRNTDSYGRQSEIKHAKTIDDERSDPEKALLERAGMYESGAGKDRNERKAFECYLDLYAVNKEAAYDPALKLAKRILYTLSPNTDIRKIDLNQSVSEIRSKWIILFAAFCRAAEGDPAAQYRLSYLLFNTEMLHVRDRTKLYWMELSARAEYIYALRTIGLLYHEGKYYAKDISKAKYWLKKAADKKDAYAMYSLAVICYNGIGTDPGNLAEAVKYFRDAAVLDFPPALYNLGMLYYAGVGVEKSDTAARSLLEKASSLGYGKATEKLRSLRT